MAQVISCLSGPSIFYVTLYDTCNYRALITNNRLNREGPLISHYNATKMLRELVVYYIRRIIQLSAISTRTFDFHPTTFLTTFIISLSNNVLICLSNDR